MVSTSTRLCVRICRISHKIREHRAITKNGVVPWRLRTRYEHRATPSGCGTGIQVLAQQSDVVIPRSWLWEGTPVHKGWIASSDTWRRTSEAEKSSSYYNIYQNSLMYSVWKWFRSVLIYYKICIMLGFLYIISISVIYMVGVFVHTYLIIPVLVSIHLCANVLFLKPVLRRHW